MLIISLFLINAGIAAVILAGHHYYWWLVLPNLISILILVIRSGWPLTITPKWWHKSGIALGLFGLSLIIRLDKIESLTPGMYGDEITVGWQAQKLWQQSEWLPFVGNYSHPTPLLWLTGGSLKLLGQTLTAIRLPSVLFGSLVPVLFFLLLTQSLPIPIAMGGGLMMTFAYPMMVLSRLAYEPPAALCFQILAGIYWVRLLKKDERALVPLWLTLALGLYTYLNFRVFVAVGGLATMLYLYRQAHNRTRLIFQSLMIFFIAAMPLLTYALIDTTGFWKRPADISIFSRHYSPGEFIKELAANVGRSSLFFLVPDPNPGKNPAKVPLVDGLTSLLAILGAVYVFRRKLPAGKVAVVMMLAAVISDSLSTEVIPEFHYYGLGHPNTLRVSGLVLGVILLAIFGIKVLNDYGRRYLPAKGAWLIGGLLVAATAYLNYQRYFNQAQISPTNYLYNYRYNEAGLIELIKLVNATPKPVYAVPQTLRESDKWRFLVNPKIKVTTQKITTLKELEANFEPGKVIIIPVDQESQTYLKTFLASQAVATGAVYVKVISYPNDIPIYIWLQQMIPTL